MNFETKHKPITSFVAISISDIVLLLLIYFLLTSTFVLQPGIKVKLPKAITGQPEKEDKVYLTLTKNDRIFLNDKLVTLSNLGAEVRPLLAKDAEKTVVIRADKDLTLESTIRVIDAVKLAGAEKFLIATEPGP